MAIYLLFIQHILYCLKDAGKAAVVVPTGFLTAKSGIERKIREKLIDNQWLKGAVSMPSNIFAIISNLYIVKTFGRIRCELAVCFFRQVCSKGMGASPIYF